jgi:hypothetical protein
MVLNKEKITPSDNEDNSQLIKALIQANQSNAFMAEILHRGAMATGSYDISDFRKLPSIDSFIKNLCLVNQAIVKLVPNNNVKTSVYKKNNEGFDIPIESVEFDSGSMPVLLDTVHNSDVTMENGLAQEQHASPWVSEFAEENSFEGQSISSSSDSLQICGETPKKRSYEDVSPGIDDTNTDQERNRSNFKCNQDYNRALTTIELVEDYVLFLSQKDSRYVHVVNDNHKEVGKCHVLLMF